MEQWKRYFDSNYVISNQGGVKLVNGNAVKLSVVNGGYLRFWLTYGDYSNRKFVAVHRLVAELFIPNDDHKPHINHKNGIKNDNRVENLEWCTPKENVNHAIETGLKVYKTGDYSGKTKATMDIILQMQQMFLGGYSKQEILKKHGIGHVMSLINNTCSRDVRTELTDLCVAETHKRYRAYLKSRDCSWVKRCLSDDEVISLRKRYLNGELVSDLQKEFDKLNVITVIRGYSSTYKHITDYCFECNAKYRKENGIKSWKFDK